MKTKLLMLFVSLMCGSTLMAYNLEVEGVCYRISGGKALVTYRGDWGPSEPYTLQTATIQEKVTYYGTEYDVVGIEQRAFENSEQLQTVIIPNSVTSIGYGAFKGCSSLVNVSIPNSVTSIGYETFMGCSSLETITIPTSVESIGYSAFSDCSSMESIDIPNSVTSIGHSVFSGCSSLVNVSLSNSITTISSSLFENCTSLTDIHIPEGVETIESRVFSGCTNLSNVYIPSSCTSISGDSFHGQNSLNIFISDLAAWSNCNINFSGASYPIKNGNLYLNGALVTNLEIPDNVTSIGNWIFSGFQSITSVSVPASVTTIGRYAFYGCTNIENLYIADLTAWINISLSDYSSPAYYAKNIYVDGAVPTAITLPEGLTMVGSYTFYNWKSLKLVTLPSTIQQIGGFAFQGCSNLESVNIPYGVTRIWNSAFRDCSSLTEIDIPSTVTMCGNNAGMVGTYVFDGCTNLKSVTLSPNAPVTGYSFRNCKSLTSINIPEGVAMMYSYAFEGCSNLQSVVLPSTLTEHWGYGFKGCTNITEIVCKMVTPLTYYSVFEPEVVENATLVVPRGTKDNYLSADGWKDFAYIDDGGVKIFTMPANSMATFCSLSDLDFSGVEGLEAYIAAGYNWGTGKVEMMRVADVPAGIGLLLKGTPGDTYEIPYGTSTSVYANLLVGITADTDIQQTDGGFTNYVLGANGFQIVSAEGGTLAGGKAYLQVPSHVAQSRKVLDISFGDEAAGISETLHKDGNAGISYFTLDGRRISQPRQKGIYLHNGKKIFVK